MIKVNSKLGQRVSGLLVLIAIVMCSVLPANAQTRRKRPRLGKYSRPPVARQARPNYYTVAANTVLRARMNEQISSESARVGDRFTTTVVDPVYAGGVEVVPAGSTVTGRVTTVQRAQRKGKAGAIGVHFISLQLPNGTARAINGDLTNLSSDNGGNADNEGQVRGRGATKRNVVFIGGGAATGALIGAIAGGGKGAGIGAVVGGGLGVAGSLFAKGHEAVVKRDTEFGVVLNQSISLPAANVR
ncbi:MAG: hypothetical protein WCB68_07205 [Pyrinomonadaceae bacterium]